MGFNKKFFTTGGIVASTPSAAAFDPLQNFETVTYTGNGGTQKITGHIRKGGAFNGSSSVITIPNIKSQLQSGASFTISCWVNVSSSQSGEAMIINTAASSGTQGVNIGIRDSTGLVYFQIRGNNNLNASGTTNLVGAGWKNIVLTHTTSSTILYVNGTQEASIGANTIGTIPNDLTFGKWANSSLYYLNGSIDQVRIFNTALNSTQVGQLALEDYTDPKKSTTDYFEDGSGVALYELDEDANTTPYYPYGTGAIDSGQSAVFNGSSSSIVINDAIPLRLTNNYTISFWVKIAAQGNLLRIITKDDGLDNSHGYSIFINPGGTLGWTHNSGSNNTWGTGFNPNENQWYNIVGTFDGSKRILYVDGSYYDEISTTVNVTGNTDKVIIGSYGASTPQGQYFNGSIEQVRIYSSALSASDVEALASETNVPTANLVAHYKLDGNGNDETTNYNATSVNNITYSDPAEFPNVAYNGTPTNVNFLGMAFQPDLVWIKSRDSIYSGNHQWYDSVRGAGKVIYSDGAYAEATNPIDGYLGSFDSNGFSLSSGTRNTNDVSNSGENYVAWCWKAADTTTTISAGTVGNTIASDVRANTDAGFSIVKYTGNSTAGATVGHGLSSVPQMIIVKRLSLPIDNWAVYNETIGNTKRLALDENAAAAGPRLEWNSTTPTNTVFTLGNHSAVNQTSGYIAYCFHSVDFYQKVGTYEGGTSAVTVNTGFEPRFVLVKNVDALGNWTLWDSIRSGTNFLQPNNSGLEASGRTLTFNSDGFTINTDADVNGNSNGHTYIYLAIA
jgi:hypothetical protein